MPIEQQDNTRIVQPQLLQRPQKEVAKQKQVQSIDRHQAQLWDADKVKKYQNMQDFYNNNFFGYGVFGNPTNYDPRTSQGQAAIQSNFDYAKSNAQTFGESVATGVVLDGAAMAIKYGTTPVKIGSGAEAVVKSAPLSTKVTKTTTIPRAEMHLRNTVPGALKSRYIGTQNGLTTYTQSKIRILTKEQIAKASKAIESRMNKKGWRRVIHQNLDGLGFTNGKHVISDLGPGNIGRDWLGRPRLVDFAMETVPEFRIAMQRRGGTIRNIN